MSFNLGRIDRPELLCPDVSCQGFRVWECRPPPLGTSNFPSSTETSLRCPPPPPLLVSLCVVPAAVFASDLDRCATVLGSHSLVLFRPPSCFRGFGFTSRRPSICLPFGLPALSCRRAPPSEPYCLLGSVPALRGTVLRSRGPTPVCIYTRQTVVVIMGACDSMRASE